MLLPITACEPSAANGSNYTKYNQAEISATKKINSRLSETEKTGSKPPTQTHQPIVGLGSRGKATLYLNQALAQLGYLPLTFTEMTEDTGQNTANWTNAASHEQPLSGTFTWKFPTLEPILEPDWSATGFSILTKGALMTYQANRGLVVDGIAGSQVWGALSSDLASHRINPNGYMNITVDKQEPETLKIWQNGQVVYASRVNTGIGSSPTENGTWPIYLRFTSQTMEGTTPWGEHYMDFGVPFVNYFHGGDAIHGFWRRSYGFPQSLGCVELPAANAKIVFHLVTYGTLVTISNHFIEK